MIFFTTVTENSIFCVCVRVMKLEISLDIELNSFDMTCVERMILDKIDICTL